MLLQDIRYALRRLWHSKGFALVAILCLGFGIGLNTTIFSVTDGVLLRPYPYPDPDRLLVVGEQNQRAGNQSGLSYLDMRDWKNANTSFTTIAASASRNMTVSDPGQDPERFQGAAVSWDLFPTLGTFPVIGHGFRPEDDQSGGGGVVLLGFSLWTTRYQADPNILGRVLTVNGQPHTVIGVMPDGFAFPNNQRLWIALTPEVEKNPRDARGLFAVGRLKPAVTTERATEELTSIAAGLANQYATTNEGWSVRIRTLREAFLPAEVSTVVYLMMAGVTLVLFIACSNVANLLLARAGARRREISVRAALGAGRGRIVRQLVTESVVLSLVSVPLGILLAEAGTRMIAAGMPPDQVPYYIRWDVSWRSLVYTFVVAITTALLFGLFPALQVSRGNLHESLKEGTRGNSASKSWLRSTLVVVQVSLALVSLVIALLFVRTFSNLDGYQLGFDPAPLMTMRFYMAGATYDPADAKKQRVQDILDRVEALPGVKAAFASTLVPISGGGGGPNVIIDGRPRPPGAAESISFAGVTPHFFQTLGVPIARGRNFTDAEGWAHLPVAIVNEVMAKRFWPTSEPVGGRFRLEGDATGEWYTVIGIAPDLKLDGINPDNDAPRAAAFVPYAYQQTLNTGLTIRVDGDPKSITAAARAALHASDPNMPISFVRTVQDIRRLSFWEYGLYGWIFATIGVVGLLLASVGVYGVLSYSVTQRTQEIGVRVALGASRRQVLQLVIGHGVLLVGIGIAFGVVLAPIGTYLARSLFYKVSPFDPVSFGGVAVLLLGVAFVASYLPALRATRVNPVEALRGE